MGLRAVTNPAAGGQPGSFTTLTVTGAATIGGGLAVTGSISATAGVEGADFRAYTADNAAGGAGVNTASVAFANGGTVKARIRSAVYGDGYMAFHVNDDTERMRLTTGGLAVTGQTTTDTLRVNVTPTAEVVVATHTAVFNINGTNYKFLCLPA